MDPGRVGVGGARVSGEVPDRVERVGLARCPPVIRPSVRVVGLLIVFSFDEEPHLGASWLDCFGDGVDPNRVQVLSP